MNNNLRTLARMQNFFLIDECPNYLFIRWCYPLYSTSGLVNPCNSFSRRVGRVLIQKGALLADKADCRGRLQCTSAKLISGASLSGHML